MASGRRITIEFLGNNSSLDRAMSASSSRSAKFGDALKKAGKVAAFGLAAGAVIAGKALFDMTKAAIEDEASQKRLATALKLNADATRGQVSAVEDWITKQGLAKGVADDELRPALEKLVGATKDVGEAQKLATLGMDVAAGSGQSLESVAKALAKAQNGSLAGLSRLGIATKDAAGETITFEQAQKRLAAQFKGSAAAQADTLQGKMNRLKLILSETGEEIGAKLIPVVTRMADWFLKVGLPAITRFGGYLQRTLPPIFERVQAVVKKVMGGLRGDVGGNLGAVKQIIRDAVSIIRSLWARFGKYITEYVVKAFKNVRQIIGGTFKVIQGLFRAVSAALKGDWKGAWEGIKMILRGASQVIVGLVKQFANLVKTALKIGWSALKGIAGAAWDGIKAATVAGAKAYLDYIKSIPGRTKSALGDLGHLLWDAGTAIIQGLINGVTSKIGELEDKFRSITNKIPDWKGPFNKDRILLTPAGVAIMSGLIAGITKGEKPLKAVLAKMTALVAASGAKLKSLVSARNSFAAGFSSFGSSVFGADMTDPETGESTASVQSILAYQQAQKAKAMKLQADVKRLVGLGLSKSLITQLQAGGEAGMAQISALAAGASRADIANLNAGDRATTSALSAAGMTAGNAIYGDQIKAAAKADKQNKALLDKLEEVRRDLAKKQEATVTIKNGAIVVAIRNVEKETGRKLLVSPK